MIEQLFRFFTSLRPTAQADAFRKRAVEQFLFRGFSKDLIERFVGDSAINFSFRQTQFQTTATNWLLPHFRRGIAERVAFVVEIAILAQPRNDCFNDGFTRTTLCQTFTQFGNRAWLGGEQLYGALKCTRTNLLRRQPARARLLVRSFGFG